MRTFTASVVILSAQIKDTTITGTAIDGDIAIDFAVANTDVNQRLFVSEAQLVITGKFRVAKAIATIGAWISSVMAVISIPAPIEAVEPEIVGVIEPESLVEDLPSAIVEVVGRTSLTPAQKRAAKKAEAELVAC